MAKFKIKYVKFVFTPKLQRGENWATPPDVKIGFGNRHTEEWNTYFFNSNHIGIIFSDYLKGDKRKYDKHAKFTESEASMLLLQYLEDNLKDARQTKKDLAKTLERVCDYGLNSTAQKSMWEYSLTVNKRELEYNTAACKIWRKKVREIKKSKEYMWEQLAK